MGDLSKEPSMEEILSSIKRIIAEEGDEPQPAPRRGRSETLARPAIEPGVAVPVDLAAIDYDDAPDASPDMDVHASEVLELTEEIAEEEPPMPAAKPSRSAPRAAAPEGDGILSVQSEIAARTSLSALSSMLIAPKDGEDNTLDGLVRAMLKPMLKEWLDTHLPVMVEDMVAKEIARITAR